MRPGPRSAWWRRVEHKRWKITPNIALTTRYTRDAAIGVRANILDFHFAGCIPNTHYAHVARHSDSFTLLFPRHYRSWSSYWNRQTRLLHIHPIMVSFDYYFFLTALTKYQRTTRYWHSQFKTLVAGGASAKACQAVTSPKPEPLPHAVPIPSWLHRRSVPSLDPTKRRGLSWGFTRSMAVTLVNLFTLLVSFTTWAARLLFT